MDYMFYFSSLQCIIIGFVCVCVESLCIDYKQFYFVSYSRRKNTHTYIYLFCFIFQPILLGRSFESFFFNFDFPDVCFLDF